MKISKRIWYWKDREGCILVRINFDEYLNQVDRIDQLMWYVGLNTRVLDQYHFETLHRLMEDRENLDRLSKKKFIADKMKRKKTNLTEIFAKNRRMLSDSLLTKSFINFIYNSFGPNLFKSILSIKKNLFSLKYV